MGTRRRTSLCICDGCNRFTGKCKGSTCKIWLVQFLLFFVFASVAPKSSSGEEALKVAILANPKMICQIPDSTIRDYLAAAQTKEKMDEMKAYTSWKEYSERNLNERERFEIEQAEFAKDREDYEKQQEKFRNPKKGPATNPRKRPADAPSDSPPSKTATQDGNLVKYFSVLNFMSSARFLSTTKPRQRGKQYFARHTFLYFSFFRAQSTVFTSRVSASSQRVESGFGTCYSGFVCTHF